MKGGKRNGAGRKIGSVGQRTIEWDNFGKKLLGEDNLERALEIMRKSKDDDFIRYFTTLAEYFKPKLARTEIGGIDGNEISIRVLREQPENDTESETPPTE